MLAGKNRNRSRLPLTVLAACFATLLTGTGAHATTTDSEIRRTTDHYLFEVTLDEFLLIRSERPHPDRLDWSSDACSYSPDSPFGYEFTASCQRHDFGYRNYKSQDRFTERNRTRIDDNFRADMYSSCAGDSLCERAADVYYYAVRQFGAGSGSTAESLRKARIAAQRDLTPK
ncbi:phospholipase A2 [Actinopolyspora xinjiangensis]|uniref:Phospholipase A2 n=1 Tax=Actinopolyspora xinjiangensis TaxID=405564 RepID=A0A1H0SV43_9ACTN|nr:phospholipase [Actinopolyspora xinjiangensis]SDP45156.1 phospholipase A2 [Actinopolyspora xinjiangensis]